jgi:hypothetical protein
VFYVYSRYCLGCGHAVWVRQQTPLLARDLREITVLPPRNPTHDEPTRRSDAQAYSTAAIWHGKWEGSTPLM